MEICIVQLEDVRQSLRELVALAVTHRVIITSNGDPIAVLLTSDEIDIREALTGLSDKIQQVRDAYYRHYKKS